MFFFCRTFSCLAGSRSPSLTRPLPALHAAGAASFQLSLSGFQHARYTTSPTPQKPKVQNPRHKRVVYNPVLFQGVAEYNVLQNPITMIKAPIYKYTRCSRTNEATNPPRYSITWSPNLHFNTQGGRRGRQPLHVRCSSRTSHHFTPNGTSATLF